MESNEEDQTNIANLDVCYACFKQAIQFEKEANYQEAFLHYSNGLEFLMVAIRFDSSYCLNHRG